MEDKTCIIIGASHAAAQLAPSLRQQGWQGKIILIGEEPHLPYHRPPLSKTFLSGEQDVESMLIRPAAVYEKFDIEVRLGMRVESIDRANKTVTLVNGECLEYSKLAFCTGARPRQVDLPGVDLKGIYYLRNIADVERIKSRVIAGNRAVIVGGGYIGLETAAMLSSQGMKVTVVEMAPRVLARVTAPELSAFYRRLHREEGVSIKTMASVTGFQGREGHVKQVLCADGEELPADLVIIGIGVVPNVELAEAAGLVVDNGIVVDQFAQTSDPDIVAAGDVTHHPNLIYSHSLRLESVPNATEQAKSAAASLCGKTLVYNALPWFWSDQYKVKLQIAGLSQGHDQVVIRGDHKTSRSFAVFYLREGKLICADCINRPQEFMISKRLIAQGQSVDPQRLADEAIVPRDF
ncbi:NAD(P)/FAD-dependent oxidoreductase [Marinomonas pollencensis]|uniref:3-phenylpropionate/trans-cinnamate dioxygenase ferredoxin reductase subunit n=1 Tax=Marinomonas pollencensis TaxID=491954 RepID=A0A3E0DNC5_9GAMM|nr:FAD-dependent oxidoreductase [Marinomonas pollencensis]REG83676.1 3-phenylpropionate/trans-cinnamate dioxygenase ferredoxin reductase subunit [Marinomonas pollencensis]